MSPSEPWQDYTQCKLAVPDYRIAKGSPGFATMQRLLKMGATYAPETRVDTSNDKPEDKQTDF